MRLAVGDPGGGEHDDEDDEDIPVAVAVRVAPLPPYQHTCVYVNPVTAQLHLGPERAFSFDYVYSGSVSQEEVYESSVHPLLTTFLDGYNVTVIAYGAGGSGKTFTLAGPDLSPALNEEQFGILPRLVRSLFHALSSSVDVKARVEVSYVQVYNEEVRDLLSDEMEPVGLEVDPLGGLLLSGLTRVHCGSIHEVLVCLDTGLTLQKSGPQPTGDVHNMSTPSHSIFSLRMEQQTYADEVLVVRQSTFQFVDLVGSDQLNSPQAGINLGLLALGNVVSALGDPRRNVTYIPYLDSLLTRLLANSLGGNSVTFIICTISPLLRDYEESLSSLLFASRAANIRTNPSPNVLRREFNNSIGPPMAGLIPPMSGPLSAPFSSASGRLRSRQNSLVSLATTTSSDMKPYPLLSPPALDGPVSLPSHLGAGPVWYSGPGLTTNGTTPARPPPLGVRTPAAANQLEYGNHGYPPYQHRSNCSAGPGSMAAYYPLSCDTMTSPYFGRPWPADNPPPADFYPEWGPGSNYSALVVGQNPTLMYGQVSPGYIPITSRTTPTSASPLSLRSPVSVNMYLPTLPTLHHARSPSSVGQSVSLPSELTGVAGGGALLGNQGHLILQTTGGASPAHNLSEPRPALDDVGNYEEVFKLQFAATQYKTLVSKAENLLQNISQQESLAPPERNEIQTWLNRKEESEQAIKRSGEGEAGKLELILEESEDDTDTQTQASDITPRQQPFCQPAEDYSNKAATAFSPVGGCGSDDFDSQESIQSMQDEDEEEDDDDDIDDEDELVSSLSSVSSSQEAADELEATLGALEQQFLADTLALAALMENRLVMEQLSSSEGRAGGAGDGPSECKNGAGSLARSVNRTETELFSVGDCGQAGSGPASAQVKEQLTETPEKDRSSFSGSRRAQENQIEKYWDGGQKKLDVLSKSVSEGELTEPAVQAKESMKKQPQLLPVRDNSDQSQFETVPKSPKQFSSRTPSSEKHVELAADTVRDEPLEAHQKEQQLWSLSQMRQQQQHGDQLIYQHQQQHPGSLVMEMQQQNYSFPSQVQKKHMHSVQEVPDWARVSAQAHLWVRGEASGLEEARQRQPAQSYEAVALCSRTDVMLEQQTEAVEETSFVQAPPGGSSITVLSSITRINEAGYLVADIASEVEELRNIRDDIIRQRQVLDDRLQEETFLPPDQERRMLELDESVEAIDSAIEYKNDILLVRNVDYETYQGDNILMQKLVVLGIGETRSLLHKYFLRVLDLRLEGRKMEIQLEEVENQYASLGKNARDLAYALQRTKLDCERRLVAQQRDYQVKINLLMQQLTEDGGDKPQLTKRIKSLEKEVHYYKKLCKELRSRREEEGEEDEDHSGVRDNGHGLRGLQDNGPSSHHGGPSSRDQARGPRTHHLQHGLRDHHGHAPRDPPGPGLRDYSAQGHGSSRTRPPEETPRRGHRPDDLDIIERVGGEEGGASDAESTVSQIQPSQILQFQRRLARLHRKMESTPKPTVTREHRKIIIENPPSTDNSLESKKNKNKKRW